MAEYYLHIKGKYIRRPAEVDIGALCFSVLLSLVATPTIYLLLSRITGRQPIRSGAAEISASTELTEAGIPAP